MNPARALFGSLCAVSAIACLDSTSPDTGDAQIRIINAANAAVSISVDGNVQLQGVSPGMVSAFFVHEGAHHLVFQGPTADNVQLDVQATENGVTTAYLYPSSAGVTQVATLDTGATVPAGKAKVRVAQLSRAIGDVDVWRVQPDFQTPTRIQTPFPYLATSPFVQSDSGFWEVFVTRVGQTAKLKSTGAFRVPGTGRRTVLLFDSVGVPVFRILPE